MTYVSNKNVSEYTFTGGTLEDLMEEVQYVIKAGKFPANDLIHAYIIWDGNEDDGYGYVMKAMVNTYKKEVK